jgi:uncharacterized membrane protein YgcG
MICNLRSLVSLCSSFGLVLILANPVAAVAPEIKDEAKFFSPEAVKKANAEIRDIYQKHNWDVLVETYPSVPPDQKDKVKAMSRDDRSRFFEAWAEERAKATAAKGLCIIVCREPTHMQFYVTTGARTALDKAAQDRIQKALLDNFREKKFDEGLAAAIKVVRDKLAAPSK